MRKTETKQCDTKQRGTIRQPTPPVWELRLIIFDNFEGQEEKDREYPCEFYLNLGKGESLVRELSFLWLVYSHEV